MQLQRWKITIEYDGSPFAGWQRQDDAPSVQQAIEQAIAKYSGEQTTLVCAGRTDAGVHALGQVAHFDLARPDPEYVILSAINAHLRPLPISLLSIEKVTSDFSARFDANKRRYIYRIIQRPTPLTIDHRRAWRIHKPLDLNAMEQAAQHFLGQHDFTSFRASECQAKSPLRSIDKIGFYTDSEYPEFFRRDGELLFVVEARSFLHHQIRNMIGTLKEIGEGKRHPDEIKTILEAKDRRVAGITAPADGLYFAKVWY